MSDTGDEDGKNRVIEPDASGQASGITASGMRRALARARDGKPLDPDEATVLLHARGDDLDDAAGLRQPDQGRRPGGGRAAGRHHLLAEGLHPADPAVPGPLRVLHLRDRPAPAGQPVPGARRGAGHRPRGRGAGLQGSPVHPGRPAGAALATGQGVAGRPRLRRHAVLRAGHGHPRAGGDRPAAAPQPGRAVLAGLPAAQAGRAVHGHDAGDHRDAPVHARRAARTSAARTRTRPSGCGSWKTRAAATSRSPPASSSASARRWPSGPTRSSPSARSPASTPASRKSSCRTSGPSRTPRCATCRTPNSTTWPPRSPSPGWCSGPRRGSRRRPTWSATSTRLILRAGIDDWGGVSPLTPDHVNPERPWPADRRARGAHRGGRLHPARAPDHLPALPARAVAGPAAGPARGRAGRPRDRPGRRGRPPARPALAGTRRRPGRRGRVGPHRPVRDHRHGRPHP